MRSTPCLHFHIVKLCKHEPETHLTDLSFRMTCPMTTRPAFLIPFVTITPPQNTVRSSWTAPALQECTTHTQLHCISQLQARGYSSHIIISKHEHALCHPMFLTWGCNESAASCRVWMPCPRGVSLSECQLRTLWAAATPVAIPAAVTWQATHVLPTTTW